MNQGVQKKNPVDGTESVSGSDSDESEFEEYDEDSLPECITKLFIDDETLGNINANDNETPININAYVHKTPSNINNKDNTPRNDLPTIIANCKDEENKPQSYSIKIQHLRLELGRELKALDISDYQKEAESAYVLIYKYEGG